jgi:hypothetical protein
MWGFCANHGQWCAKSITAATSQISAVSSHKYPLRHCRRTRISAPQTTSTTKKIVNIGRTAENQTNGSPVVECNPLSWGIAQPLCRKVPPLLSFGRHLRLVKEALHRQYFTLKFPQLAIMIVQIRP